MLHILCSSNLRLWDSSTLSHFFSTTFATFGTVILYELSFFHWSACPIWSTRFYPHFSFNLEVAMFLAVVCFKGSRAKHLPRPPFLGPTRCYAHKFSWFMVKNVLSTHIMCDKADQCNYSAFNGPPTEIVICRYFAFKGAPNSNCNLKVICFQKGPQQPLKCVNALLSNFIEGAPQRNCSVYVICFQRGPQKQLLCVSTLFLIGIWFHVTLRFLRPEICKHLLAGKWWRPKARKEKTSKLKTKMIKLKQKPRQVKSGK